MVRWIYLEYALYESPAVMPLIGKLRSRRPGPATFARGKRN